MKLNLRILGLAGLILLGTTNISKAQKHYYDTKLIVRAAKIQNLKTNELFYSLGYVIPKDSKYRNMVIAMKTKNIGKERTEIINRELHVQLLEKGKKDLDDKTALETYKDIDKNKDNILTRQEILYRMNKEFPREKYNGKIHLFSKFNF
ncbi:MAG: hypothetical protein U9R42_01180 [Bacteroidota bacterium]|nr:hypothetical protein [Bacteroidota bacterium]